MSSPIVEFLAKVLLLMIGIFALLSLLLAYLFPFHLLPWTTFYNEWLFALFVGFGLAWVGAHRSVILVDIGPWLTVLLLATLHMWVVGQIEPTQITLWTVFLGFGLVGWLACSLGLNLRGTYWLKVVLAMIWLAAVVSALIAVLQWSGIVSGANWDPGFILYSEGGGRVSSNIGHANNLGTLLVMGLGVVGYAWYAAEDRSLVWRVLAVLSVLLLVSGVYFSGSRTAMLNLLLWPALFFVWARWRDKPWPWLALLPVILLAALQLVMPTLIEWWGLFPVQEARSIASEGNRPRLWMMMLKAIGENPWLGYGFGAVANINLRHSPEFGSFDLTIVHHAHNTVLDMWAIFGLPLGTLIVGGVVWMWVRAWLKSQSVAEQFIWLMATAMLVHAMLEYPLHYGFFFWLLCLLLGALGAKEWNVINIRHAAPASMAWLAVFMAVAVPVWHAYVQTESLYTAFRQRGPEATHQLLKELPPTLGQTLYPELYERLHWATMPMSDVLVLPNAGLAALERQASRYPLPTLGWRMAFAQAARGNAEQATWWAQRMCRMFDPRVCASAAEEWKRRGAENPSWPELPWGKWLPSNAGVQ